MSQRQPLMTGAGTEPSAPTQSPVYNDGPMYNNNGYNPAQMNAAPPPAYTMGPTNPSANQPYAPGAPIMQQQQQPAQSQPQAHLQQQQPYVINQQIQQTNNQPPQPYGIPQQQQQVPQGQMNNYNNNQNMGPNYNYYGQPGPATIDKAAAPAAGVGRPIGQPNTTVVVVPANNGYAAMPPGGGVRPVGPGVVRPYPGGPGRVYPGGDEPGCLYVFAILSIFFPLLGLIVICCLNCGSGLGPRRSIAFRRLVIFTIIGLIINGIFWWNEDWWYDDDDEHENEWHDN